MSRTNSAPNSPMIGRREDRTNSPRMNRSFRGEKDIGELTKRIKNVQIVGYKNRRDDSVTDGGLPPTPHLSTSNLAEKDKLGGCCGGHPTSNTLSVPSSPTTRSKSPGIKGVPNSPNIKRPITPGNNLSLPSTPRCRSKSPGLVMRPHKSPNPKRPTSLMTPTLNNISRRTPSPNFTTSPHAPSSPRASPARQTSLTPRALTPVRHPRSPATPTKSLPADIPGPDLTDPDVLAKIGNRAVKTVTKPTRYCDQCQQPLTDDGCTAFGKVFHKDCFRCSGCKKKLEGKFFSKDESPFCLPCYKASQEECCVCKNKIVGDCIVNNESYYHPGCMKCQICDEQLKDSYFFFKDKPICEKDFKETQQLCSVCGEVIVGTYYTQNDQILCEKDYKSKIDKCGKCDKPIDEHGIQITGAVFHPDCFRCEVCKKKLEGKPFSTDDQNKLYCPSCHTVKFAAKCSVCHKPIVPKKGQTKAPRVRAMDRDFHLQCFKCEECNMVLDSKIKGKECWPLRNHILCRKCNTRKQCESESDEG